MIAAAGSYFQAPASVAIAGTDEAGSKPPVTRLRWSAVGRVSGDGNTPSLAPSLDPARPISRKVWLSSASKAAPMRSIAARATSAPAFRDAAADQIARLAIAALAESRVSENHITCWPARPAASRRLRSFS